MLQDDPNYLPDFDMLPLGMDLLNMDMAAVGDSQRTALSPFNSQLPASSGSSLQDIGGINIPQSASSLMGGPVRGSGGFSARGGSAAGTRVEIRGLDEDLGMVIDDDGNLLILDEAPPPQSGMPSAGGHATGAEVLHSGQRNSAQPIGLTSDAVRQSWTLTAPSLTLSQVVIPDDDDFRPMQDDDAFPRDVQGAAPGAGAMAGQTITSEETAAAPAQRRQRVVVKTIPCDTRIEMRNSDIAQLNAGYVENMREAIRQKQAAHDTALAKKNAEYWILGTEVPGPLGIFRGARLLEALTGVNLRESSLKRPRDEGYETDEGRRVRPRSSPPADQEIGRFAAQDDEGYQPMLGDDTIEQGRKAPTPLDDRHASSMMPWNQSAGSRRPTALFSAGGVPTSASFGGAPFPPGSLSRRPSRLASASPLIGRGLAQADMDDFALPGAGLDSDMTGLDDFEMFGPAAQVDTQTAGQSQWQRQVLDGESVNFLDFIQTSIKERNRAREEDPLGNEDDLNQQSSIDFESLLPPTDHSRIVAAQALLHVLALRTKNMLEVDQPESFGPITMRTFGTAASQ